LEVLKIAKIHFYVFPEMIVLLFCYLKYDVFFYRWKYAAYFNAKTFEITMKFLQIQGNNYGTVNQLLKFKTG